MWFTGNNNDEINVFSGGEYVLLFYQLKLFTGQTLFSMALIVHNIKEAKIKLRLRITSVKELALVIGPRNWLEANWPETYNVLEGIICLEPNRVKNRIY